MLGKKLTSLLILLTGAVLTITGSAQDAPNLKTTEVAPGITMVQGAGGNFSIITGDRYVALVDNGYGSFTDAVIALVEETVGRPVSFIINTHVHGDHTGANARFAESGTIVFAHEKVRSRLADKMDDAGGPAGLPVVTFGDGVNFFLGGLEARVIHHPGAHTDGDSYLHFPGANVIHAGDLVFHGLFPYIDLDQGGSVDGFIAAQAALLARANDTTVIVPGHGELTDKAGLSEDLDVLKAGFAKVKQLVSQGMSDEDIVAANPLQEFDARNWQFITTERMTRTFIHDAREQ